MYTSASLVVARRPLTYWLYRFGITWEFKIQFVWLAVTIVCPGRLQPSVCSWHCYYSTSYFYVLNKSWYIVDLYCSLVKNMQMVDFDFSCKSVELQRIFLPTFMCAFKVIGKSARWAGRSRKIALQTWRMTNQQRNQLPLEKQLTHNAIKLRNWWKIRYEAFGVSLSRLHAF